MHLASVSHIPWCLNGVGQKLSRVLSCVNNVMLCLVRDPWASFEQAGSRCRAASCRGTSTNSGSTQGGDDTGNKQPLSLTALLRRHDFPPLARQTLASNLASAAACPQFSALEYFVQS